MLTGAAAPGSIEVDVSGLRSAKGNLLFCLTANPNYFPNCKEDPQAHRAKIPAGRTSAVFDNLASGDYAVSLIHDENANGKLDRRLGIPSEGVGFSRNPRLMFGPPRFDKVSFVLGTGAIAQPVKMRYFL
jgi:uncharacterized protein (DUF2141 family)